MHFFLTKNKPVYAGIAAISFMILTGLTLAGAVVLLTVMTPVFLVLLPILVPAVITSSFLATGFLASGSLGASAIALLLWLYKKEEYSRSNMHARVRPKGAKGWNLSRGDKPPEEDRPPERDKLVEEIKPTGRDKATGIKLTERDKAEEYKSSEKDKSSKRDNPAEEDRSLREFKHAEEGPSIPEISKVLLAEQNPTISKRCGPGASRKRSDQARFAMDPSKRSSLVKSGPAGRGRVRRLRHNRGRVSRELHSANKKKKKGRLRVLVGRRKAKRRRGLGKNPRRTQNRTRATLASITKA